MCLIMFFFLCFSDFKLAVSCKACGRRSCNTQNTDVRTDEGETKLLLSPSDRRQMWHQQRRSSLCLLEFLEKIVWIPLTQTGSGRKVQKRLGLQKYRKVFKICEWCRVWPVVLLYFVLTLPLGNVLKQFSILLKLWSAKLLLIFKDQYWKV